MISVTIGNNLNRSKKIYEDNTTLREALEDSGINYSVGSMHLDGASLAPGDIDKTFAEMGITSTCFLINVVKADSAK